LKRRGFCVLCKEAYSLLRAVPIFNLESVMNTVTAHVDGADVVVTTKDREGKTVERLPIPGRLKESDLPAELCGWVENLALHGLRPTSIHLYPYPLDADGNSFHVGIFCSTAVERLQIERAGDKLCLAPLRQEAGSREAAS
jgi:hypothetical protein